MGLEINLLGRPVVRRDGAIRICREVLGDGDTGSVASGSRRLWASRQVVATAVTVAR